MEGGLSDRALKVLRAALHEKVGMALDELPDPALVADQISLTELACLRSCGYVTVARDSELDSKARLRTQRRLPSLNYFS